MKKQYETPSIEITILNYDIYLDVITSSNAGDVLVDAGEL